MTGAVGTSPVQSLRARLAQLVWFCCVLVALLLATSCVLVALRVDESRPGVDVLLAAADVVDLRVFDRHVGMTAFSAAKSMRGQVAILSWGTAALTWLLAGWLLAKVLGPRR